MKTKLLGLIALSWLVGCVPSLNPVATEDQWIFEPDVVGVWVQPKAGDRWEFTKRDDTSYRLLYTDKDGQQGRFIARLAEIDGTRLLDLFPEEQNLDASGFYKFHLVPIHTIYLVKRTSPRVELAVMDYKWFNQFLIDHPNAIQSATFNDRKMLTAPTSDVQKFVLQNKARFNGDVVLERHSDATN